MVRRKGLVFRSREIRVAVKSSILVGLIESSWSGSCNCGGIGGVAARVRGTTGAVAVF